MLKGHSSGSRRFVDSSFLNPAYLLIHLPGEHRGEVLVAEQRLSVQRLEAAVLQGELLEGAERGVLADIVRQRGVAVHAHVHEHDVTRGGADTLGQPREVEPGGDEPHRVDVGQGVVEDEGLLDVVEREDEVLQHEVVLPHVAQEGLLHPGEQLVVHGQQPA